LVLTPDAFYSGSPQPSNDGGKVKIAKDLAFSYFDQKRKEEITG